MKLKLFATVVLLAAGAMTISAQEGCDQNSSLSHEYVKAGNFKDAYEPWKAVMKDCPTLRYYTYTDGFTLLEGLMKTQTKGSAQYQAYFDEMMAAYDQLTKHLGDFRATGIPTPERVLTNKIQDYLKLAPEIDAKYAYTELRKVTDLQKDAALGSAIFYMLQQSFALLANDATHKEQFLTDYMNSTEWMDKKIADTTSENTKASYARIRENLDALLINSGAATCESLEGIYKDKVETSKTDMEFLQQVLTVMRKLKCTETDTYFQAAYYAYQIQPTAEAAIGCANMSYKKGDYEAAAKFFDEAITLESTPALKADYAYKAAASSYAIKQYIKAKQYLTEALKNNPNHGDAYILLAHCYGASPRWTDEAALNACTYFVVLDKLARAKQVDPSVAEKANEEIARYSAYLPKTSDLFMIGYKNGDTINIGGWIGETTRIRF